MNASSSLEAPGIPSPAQRDALIRLLDDDDPVVYEAVRDKILSCGDAAVGWLRPHLTNPDPTIRQRVRAMVDHLDRQGADNRFLAFCLSQGDDFDVEHGAWLLAQTRYPEINVAAYQALLDSYAGDLREPVAAAGDPTGALAEINRYLFGQLGYTGNEMDYYDPDNSYLNRVMDRRMGNPISLCMIYLAVARRLRLPMVGIGMPGHFLCRYQSSREELFVDAFHSGKVLTKADCVNYLTQSSYGFHEGLLAPATPRRILLRMCSNLHQIHLHLKQKEESAQFHRYVVALAR